VSTQPLTEMKKKNVSGGVERGRRVNLTTLLPSVNQLFRQCGIFKMSQPYRPPLPVTGLVAFSTSTVNIVILDEMKITGL
jgi:hypothetical protein